MYGKHFSQMYEGSMVGAGAVVFAVMGYVIAKQVPDRKVGSQVELNPPLVAFILGCSAQEVEKAIEFLCSPDARSRSKEEEGRRLVKIGEFAYCVVNGAKYRAMRDEDKRREQVREAQRRFRSKREPEPDPQPAALVEPEPKAALVRFQKPSYEEAGLYAVKLGLPDPEVIKFMDYYESNGWKVGRNPMRSWQAAMRNWKNNLRNYENNSNSGGQRTDRNVGTANEGHHGQYDGIGKLAGI